MIFDISTQSTTVVGLGFIFLVHQCASCVSTERMGKNERSRVILMNSSFRTFKLGRACHAK